MAVEYTGAGVEDPPVRFLDGVAAVDLLTLKKAAQALSAQGVDVLLPEAARPPVPAVFDSLCRVEVTPGPVVTATIDTQKMGWALGPGSVSKGRFADYAGAARYAVRFTSREVFLIDGLGLAAVPTRLKDGRRLSLWFAEVPEPALRSSGYYGLHAQARRLTESTVLRRFDERFLASWITVPAQQIRWSRKMEEIVRANAPGIEHVTQQVFMALDQTGVRVKAATSMRGASAPLRQGPPRGYAFGAQHPVVMWLTEPGSALPFAVVATTTEAWLDPDAAVSFADSAFQARRI